MANTSELEKGLNELKRLTGITLTVTAEDSEQEQMALEQIRCLCLAYREKYNKNDFLLRGIAEKESTKPSPGSIYYQ